MKYKLVLGLLALVGSLFATILCAPRPSSESGAEIAIIDVHPGDDIQEVLEAASSYSIKPEIRVHAGTYRPSVPGQALISLNARHDGVTVEAVGEVILTAANSERADHKSPGYPAIVNHVVYFGDQLSHKTVFRGFKITGANGFVQGPKTLMRVESVESLVKSSKFSTLVPAPIEQNYELPKTHYFFTDGGGILIYGRSYPTIENVEIYGNYSSVCGAAVSVQHQLERSKEPVVFKNCIFRNNQAAVSGAAADLLSPGSWASFENCLFVGNLSNLKIDANQRSGYGALTVFPDCFVSVIDCTFTGNGAGVDDRGAGSVYRNTIFWKNNLPGGVNRFPRYELDIANARGVSGCFVHGDVDDLRSNVNPRTNTFDPPDPDFDHDYRPRHPLWERVGYRPVQSLP
jgi:hypothetical protein